MSSHVFLNRQTLLTWKSITINLDEDKDLFIGRQEFVVGYSNAPEQLQISSSASLICHSHAMTRTGHEPATIRIAAQELSLPRYALRHGR